MLTTPSYVTAMLLYWVAAIIGLVLMRRLWFTMPLRPAGGAALGLIGGLLLLHFGFLSVQWWVL
jgi:hypothetical protein